MKTSRVGIVSSHPGACLASLSLAWLGLAWLGFPELEFLLFHVQGYDANKSKRWIFERKLICICYFAERSRFV